MSELANIRKRHYSSNKGVTKAQKGMEFSKSQVLKGLELLKASDTDNSKVIEDIQSKINSAKYTEFTKDSFVLKDGEGLDIKLGTKSDKDKNESRVKNSDLLKQAIELYEKDLATSSSSTTAKPPTYDEYLKQAKGQSIKGILNASNNFTTSLFSSWASTPNEVKYPNQSISNYDIGNVGKDGVFGEYYYKKKDPESGRDLYYRINPQFLEAVKQFGLTFDSKGVLEEPSNDKDPVISEEFRGKLNEFKDYLLDKGLINQAQADAFTVSEGRSTKRQAYLWLTGTSGANKPGTSKHEVGLAADLNIPKDAWDRIFKTIGDLNQEDFKKWVKEQFGLKLIPHDDSFHVEYEPVKPPTTVNKRRVIDDFEFPATPLYSMNEATGLNIDYPLSPVTGQSRTGVSSFPGQKSILPLTNASEPQVLDIQGKLYIVRVIKYTLVGNNDTSKGIKLEVLDATNNQPVTLDNTQLTEAINQLNNMATMKKKGGVIKAQTGTGNLLNRSLKVKRAKVELAPYPYRYKPNGLSFQFKNTQFKNTNPYTYKPEMKSLGLNLGPAQSKVEGLNEMDAVNSVIKAAAEANATIGPLSDSSSNYNQKYDKLLKSLTSSAKELAHPAMVSGFNLANKAYAKMKPLVNYQAPIRPVEGMPSDVMRSNLSTLSAQLNNMARPSTSSSRLNTLSKLGSLGQYNNAVQGLAEKDALMYQQDKARFYKDQENEGNKLAATQSMNLQQENKYNLETAADLVKRRADAANVWNNYFTAKQEDKNKRQLMVDHMDLQNNQAQYAKELADLDRRLALPAGDPDKLDKTAYTAKVKALKELYSPSKLMMKTLFSK